MFSVRCDLNHFTSLSKVKVRNSFVPTCNFHFRYDVAASFLPAIHKYCLTVSQLDAAAGHSLRILHNSPVQRNTSLSVGRSTAAVADMTPAV
jgi:hypothetical protein